MASKIFMDANVILEFLLQRKEAAIVDKLFVRIQEREYKAFTSVSVLQICSYWIEKYFGSDKAKKLLLGLIRNVDIIDASQEYVILALNSSIDDIEDAFQYYTALQHKVDYLISFDKKLIKESSFTLPVYSPGKFLDI